MAEEMPAIGTQAVHKDNHKDSKGPVWRVAGQDADKNEVKLKHQPGHKLNSGLQPETRDVKLPDFHKDYVQL